MPDVLTALWPLSLSTSAVVIWMVGRTTAMSGSSARAED